ncbi:Pr6Pr family membrane protein [Streptomyces sp. ISL-90]|nr:Pr6Pr family membrane protein [Streptomyces sp. ISL-90]
MTVTSETKTETARGSRVVLFASLRLLVVIAVATAIVATFFDTASRATINPFNFFGFFTMQSNIITAVILLLAAVATFRGRPQTPLLVLLRACATTYIIIVGIVYNTLLAGLEGGISLEWANWVLHVTFPIYAALDWILFGDRSAVPWRRLWVVLIFPMVWIVVVLIRGATDGWVPYPFLDPALGYGIVAMYAIVIFIATVVVGALVFAISRVRVIAP